MSVQINNETKISMENQIVNLKDIINNFQKWYVYLKSKLRVVLIFILFGLLICFTLFYTQKLKYSARLTFAMEEDKGVSGGLAGAAGIASQIGIDLGSSGGSAFSSSNLMELMKSRLLIEKTLLDTITIDKKTKTLADYYAENEGLRKKWDKNPDLKNINFNNKLDRSYFTFQQDSLLKILYKRILSENVSVQSKDKKITIMTLEVVSSDQLFSKFFCENLAIETTKFYIETKTKKSKNNVEILQQQVDSLKKYLDEAISGVASATDKVYNLNPAFNINGSSSKKKQVNVQANTVVLTQLIAQLELAKINLRKETPLIQIIDRPILPLDDDKYNPIIILVLFIFTSFIIAISYLVLLKMYNDSK